MRHRSCWARRRECLRGDVAPADRPRKPILGRFRDPTGGHYDPSARSFAGQAASGFLGKRSRVQVLSLRGMRKPGTNGASPGSADPGSEIATMARREARRVPQGMRGLEKGCADRRAIPSALREGERSPPRRERKTGVPGAATKNTGDDARLHHIRSFPRKRESSALLKNWAPASAGASGRVGAFSSLPLRGGRLRAMTAVQIHCNHARAKARG